MKEEYKKYTILVVDDSATLRQVVSIALKGAGYDVIEGSDGKDALAKLNGQKVHLIISDVNMPRMNGIEFVKAAKALPNYRFLPILMLTTESSDLMKQAGRAAGATGWLVKPFDPARLLDVIKKVIR